LSFKLHTCALAFSWIFFNTINPLQRTGKFTSNNKSKNVSAVWSVLVRKFWSVLRPCRPKSKPRGFLLIHCITEFDTLTRTLILIPRVSAVYIRRPRTPESTIQEEANRMPRARTD
jgi:hypothetical protein